MNTDGQARFSLLRHNHVFLRVGLGQRLDIVDNWSLHLLHNLRESSQLYDGRWLVAARRLILSLRLQRILTVMPYRERRGLLHTIPVLALRPVVPLRPFRSVKSILNIELGLLLSPQLLFEPFLFPRALLTF